MNESKTSEYFGRTTVEDITEHTGKESFGAIFPSYTANTFHLI